MVSKWQLVLEHLPATGSDVCGKDLDVEEFPYLVGAGELFRRGARLINESL